MIKINTIPLTLFFLVFCVKGIAQNAIIQGTLTNDCNINEVWFSQPIDGNPESFCAMYSKSLIKENQFKKKLRINDNALVSIFFNETMPKIYLLCYNADSINILVTKVNPQKFTFNFEGSNSKGQEILNRSSLFHSFQLQDTLAPILNMLIKNGRTIGNIIDYFEKYKSHLIAPLDTLFAKGYITSTFYQSIVLEAEMTFLSAIGSVARNYMDLYAVENNMAMDSQIIIRSKLTELQKFYYSKYDPFLAKYSVDESFRGLNAGYKCKLIENGILPGIKNNIGLWVKENEKSWAYAPIKLQHTMKAINLSYNAYYDSKEHLTKNIADFELLKKAFPNSLYIPFLKKHFESKLYIPNN